MELSQAADLQQRLILRDVRDIFHPRVHINHTKGFLQEKDKQNVIKPAARKSNLLCSMVRYPTTVLVSCAVINNMFWTSCGQKWWCIWVRFATYQHHWSWTSRTPQKSYHSGLDPYPVNQWFLYPRGSGTSKRSDGSCICLSSLSFYCKTHWAAVAPSVCKTIYITHVQRKELVLFILHMPQVWLKNYHKLKQRRCDLSAKHRQIQLSILRNLVNNEQRKVNMRGH